MGRVTTYFVIPDKIAKEYGFKYGSDANSGTSFDSAFKTLSHAISITAENRDKIYIVGDKKTGGV